MYVCITYIYIYTHTYTCIHAHTHIHTCTHTYIYTYMQTCIQGLEDVAKFGQEKAKEVVGEREALCDTVVKFVLEEAALDWMAPKGKVRLGPGA